MLEEGHEYHCKYYNYELGKYQYPLPNIKAEVELMVSKGLEQENGLWLACNIRKLYKSEDEFYRRYNFHVYVSPYSPFITPSAIEEYNRKDYRKFCKELIKDIKNEIK
jgi:hypothetical protein